MTYMLKFDIFFFHVIEANTGLTDATLVFLAPSSITQSTLQYSRPMAVRLRGHSASSQLSARSMIKAGPDFSQSSGGVSSMSMLTLSHCPQANILSQNPNQRCTHFPCICSARSHITAFLKLLETREVGSNDDTWTRVQKAKLLSR